MKLLVVLILPAALPVVATDIGNVVVSKGVVIDNSSPEKRQYGDGHHGYCHGMDDCQSDVTVVIDGSTIFPTPTRSDSATQAATTHATAKGQTTANARTGTSISGSETTIDSGITSGCNRIEMLSIIFLIVIASGLIQLNL